MMSCPRRPRDGVIGNVNGRMLFLSIWDCLLITECCDADVRNLRCGIMMAAATEKTRHKYREPLVCVLRLHEMLRPRTRSSNEILIEISVGKILDWLVDVDDGLSTHKVNIGTRWSNLFKLVVAGAACAVL